MQYTDSTIDEIFYRLEAQNPVGYMTLPHKYDSPASRKRISLMGCRLRKEGMVHYASHHPCFFLTTPDWLATGRLCRLYKKQSSTRFARNRSRPRRQAIQSLKTTT
jgi:hypothetical protein